MKLLGIVLAIPVALVVWQWVDDTRTERRLEPVASLVAGRQVEARCQSFWAALIDPQVRHGEVRYGADGVPEAQFFLIHQTCDRLAAFTGQARHPELDCLRTLDLGAAEAWRGVLGCGKKTRDTIFALHTLAHEAYHNAGVKDEKATNCYAAQALAFTAVSLGAPAEEGELVARAMTALLPVQGTNYGTRECVHGGGYDLHPETAAFPTETPLRAPLGFGGVKGLASGAR